MSQESDASAAAAMDNMEVNDMQPMRSDSELLAAAADLDAEIESNKGQSLGGGSSGIPAGNPVGKPVGVDSTGKGGSDGSDIFSGSEEDEDEAAAAARAKLIRDTIKDGKHS
eukprot:2020860-Prymnesium_polylepis.1